MRVGLSVFIFLWAIVAQAADYVPSDVVWTSQSRNSSESMPCGGHDIGLNVWVEQGDVLFYAQQSGWFDENNTLLKAGRWRLHIDGHPFDGQDFEQRLCLDEGCIYIRGGGVEVRIWADVEQPVVFVATQSQHTERAVLSYESWRYRDRPVTKAECQQCSYKWLVPKDCMTFADSIEVVQGSKFKVQGSGFKVQGSGFKVQGSGYKVQGSGFKVQGSGREVNSLRFRHQNRAETVFDFTVSHEHLDAIKDSLYDPIGSLLMQGEMTAPGFRFAGTTDGLYASTDYRSWNFVNEKLRKSVITIQLQTLPQPHPPMGWAGGGPAVSASRKRSARWWHQYWQRSWIVSDTPNDSLQAMLRNYELMRYMLGCNARGQWPTKFNGGLFTFDPVYADSAMAFTPDYRKWGGGTMTAQNQRLVYWPLLKSGDHDVLRPQTDTYLRMLPNAVARTRYYWGHGGASFTEQIENFGLPNPAEYGKHKEGDDLGVERNAWLEYEWDTALEFALMGLMSNEQLAMSDYSLAEEILRFFDEHYQWQARRLGSKALDENGHLIIYPGSGCETYKIAYNPSSTIAALRACSALLTRKSRIYGASGISGASGTSGASGISGASGLSGISGIPGTSVLSGFSERIPEIPFRVIDGDTCIAPAVAWARVQNVETPQLYPVWPWCLYGMGRPGLDIARNTYWKDPHAVKMRDTKGWKQDNIWAACLGLTDEARRLNLEKFSDGPYRFTAFWEPGFDWAPDHNRGGAGMIGLQEMLLQETPEGEPILLPAWPREWNCHFRLHTLSGKIVEASVENGSIVSVKYY